MAFIPFIAQMIEPSENNLRDITTRSDRHELPLIQTSGYPSSFPSNEVPPSLDQGQNQAPIPSITVNSSVYTHFVTPEEHNPQRSLLGHSPIMGPSIDIVPPTPMEHQTSQDYEQTNSSVALNSSTSSPVLVAPPPRSNTSRRQPRFTMGPRADCEKCRLGIKGHFVHLE
jgi:hypothetical protein